MIPFSPFGLSVNILSKYTQQCSGVTLFLSSKLLRIVYSNANSNLFIENRNLSTSKAFQRSKTTKILVAKSYFENENKNKETFLEAIRMYKARERQLRGHIEFIYSAVSYLEEFGVERDLEIYKKLLDIMPKGTMIPTNIFQQEFQHYPRHQDCVLEVLDLMENNGVIPDSELYTILVNTFGRKGRPVLKLARMLYWMPKFKHACPWALPPELPKDALELAKLALIQINSVDPASKITVFETKEVKDAIDDTWIVNAISPTQKELISQHPKKESLKVEGPFGVILQDQRISYFVLRADPKPVNPKQSRKEIDDVRSLVVWVTEELPENDKELIKIRSVHEQQDGIIMATCATGTSSRDSLLSWIRLLEKANPELADIPVLFTQTSPLGDIIVSPGQEKAVDAETQTNSTHAE